jgi:chitodextrinase
MKVIRGNKVIYSNVEGITQQAPVVNATVVTKKDTVKPSGPANIIATALSPSQISLKWSIATDNVAVKSYDLFRNNVLIKNTTATSFKDVGLKADTTYNYKVMAKDAAENVSVGAITSATTLKGTSSPKPPTKGGGKPSDKPTTKTQATTEETKTGFWAGLSTTQKGLVVIGGAILAYMGYKKFVKKGK